MDRPPAFHQPQLCVFCRKDDIFYATMLGSNSYLHLCDDDFVSDAHYVYRSRLESAIDGRQKKRLQWSNSCLPSCDDDFVSMRTASIRAGL
jgi:hypothetical protein